MKSVVSLVALFCLFAGAAAGAGALHGIVHDPQHRPIPGAEIVIGHQTLQSDANGEFQVDNIPEGSYRVTVSAAGFKNLLQTVTVGAGKSPVIHLQLEIAQHSETIEVPGAAGKLQTQTS